MKNYGSFLLFFCLVISFYTSYSQRDTTRRIQPVPVLEKSKTSISVQEKDKRNPVTAGLLAMYPGGGQIYNHKWWKLPIVYGGLGTSAYLIVRYGKMTLKLRNEYFFRTYSAIPYYDPELAKFATKDAVQTELNKYRRRMEICVGLFAIVYMLSVVDAVVDAHLFYFDVSDDLSMKLSPVLITSPSLAAFSAGLSFQFNFQSR